MKISIVDLMGHYYGDPMPIRTPQSAASGGPAEASEPAPRRKNRRAKKPLLAAAVLLLVVTAAAIAPFVLSRTTGSRAMNEGGASVESVLETLPTELPAVTSESDQENTADGMSIQKTVSPQVIEGALDLEARSCHGNLLYVGGSYYTLSENGPEQVPIQNLTTTVELLGSTWEVCMDYAVIDGVLAFRSLNYPGMDRTGKDHPGATAYEVPGSADTVQLLIRPSAAFEDNCNYMFFYNIFTGEITDPLSNLDFDYSIMSSVDFNGTHTRAVVETVEEEPLPEEVLRGKPEGVKFAEEGCRRYVCDLTTGEMTPAIQLLAPYFPEDEPSNAVFVDRGSQWADDDTLLFWMLERIVPENLDLNDMAAAEKIECHNWLFSYNLATGVLNYRLRDVEPFASILVVNQPYMHGFSSDDAQEFQVTDTAAGTVYTLEGVSLEHLKAWDVTGSRAVLVAGDGGIYLVDDTKMAWSDLSAYLVPPDGEIQSAALVTEDWLCVMTMERAYCYQIPKNILMRPLTEK